MRHVKHMLKHQSEFHRSIIPLFHHSILFLLLTSCFLFAASKLASAEVRLPSLVSDGMVLQRNTGVRIWGWAKPGQQVTIQFVGRSYETVTRPDSEWAVMLLPMKAGGPYSMNINGMVISNIMIGDVWLCSGQSNMWLVVDEICFAVGVEEE